jgi:hypothetical protein
LWRCIPQCCRQIAIKPRTICLAGNLLRCCQKSSRWFLYTLLFPAQVHDGWAFIPHEHSFAVCVASVFGDKIIDCSDRERRGIGLADGWVDSRAPTLTVLDCMHRWMTAGPPFLAGPASQCASRVCFGLLRCASFGRETRRSLEKNIQPHFLSLLPPLSAISLRRHGSSDSPPFLRAWRPAQLVAPSSVHPVARFPPLSQIGGGGRSSIFSPPFIPKRASATPEEARASVVVDGTVAVAVVLNK